MKWAVIGLGGAGLAHARRITQVQGLTLAGGFDPLPEARARFTAELGLSAHETLEALLADPSIDVVTIAASSATHADLAVQALQAGKHVLVEKPFAPDAPAAQRMIDTARAAGCVVAPFHNRRYDADFLMVREVIESGRLGRVRRIASAIGGPSPNRGWRAVRALGGGRLYDWGPHLLDQLLSLDPSHVIDVRGVTFVLDSGSGDADEYFRADLRFADGLDATAEMCGFAFLPPVRWTVYGEAGSLRLTGNIHADFALTVCLKDQPPVTTATTFLTQRAQRGDGSVRVYEELRDHLLGKADLKITAADALRVTRLLDAVRRSAEVEHRSVAPA